MSLFSMHTFCTLGDLFLLQTQSLYDVEQRLSRIPEDRRGGLE